MQRILKEFTSPIPSLPHSHLENSERIALFLVIAMTK